jgi:hypothetical protein
MIRGMEGEGSSGAMGKPLKVSGKMARKMVTVSGEALRVIFMKDNGKITNKPAKESILTLVVQSTPVISKIFLSMEEVRNSFRTETTIQVSIKMVSLTVTANIFGKTETDTKESLLTVQEKEEGLYSKLME